jgi:hypothetical protein
MGEQLVSLHQGHVLDEQADHALALPRRRGGVVPEPRKVRGEREHLLALLLAEQTSVAATLAIVVFLGDGQRPQLDVPLRLQGVGDETVVGIDTQVAALCQLSFVAGAFDLLATQPVGLVGSGS